jgi:hypothetical protein
MRVKSIEVRLRVPFMALCGILVGTLLQNASYAAAPNCAVFNGQGYCQYNGRVAQAYINSSNMILLVFDTPAVPASVSAVGITGVSDYSAAAFHILENPDYAKALYATLLAAQARGATISVQLWGTYAGYLKMDRIWINE